MGPGELQEEKGVGGHHITTRAARKMPYTVELAVFLDDSLVSYVRERYPSANARKKTKEIVMTLLAVVSLGNSGSNVTLELMNSPFRKPRLLTRVYTNF